MSRSSLYLIGLLALSGLIAACEQRQSSAPDYTYSPDAELTAYQELPRPIEPVMTISAQEWVALFEQNAIQGNQKMGGKIVRVIGNVLAFKTKGLFGEEMLLLQVGDNGNSRLVQDPMFAQLLGNGSLLGMGLADSMHRNPDYHMWLEFGSSQKHGLAALSKGEQIVAICEAENSVARGRDCVLDTQYQFLSDAKNDAPDKHPSTPSSTATAEPKEEIYTGTDYGDADDIPLDTPAILTSSPTPVLKPGGMAWVLPISEVNLRAAPNVSSPLVAQLRRSAQLRILGDSAVRNEDEGRETHWLTVELYVGDFCLPPDLGKQAACLNWQRAAPNSPPPAPIKGWVNRNKIVQVQP